MTGPTGGQAGPVADLSLSGALNIAEQRRFVQEAVSTLGARDGAIYAVTNPRALELVVAYEDYRQWREDGDLYRRGLRLLTEPSEPRPQRRWASWASSEHQQLCLAVSLDVDDKRAGVLMLSGLPAVDATTDLLRLGHLPDLMALTLQHVRVVGALRERGQEVRDLREQVEGFAMDFRTAYRAERQRTQQLLDALGGLENTYRQAVSVLARAVGAKDPYTGGHLHRVRRYGMMLTALVAPDHTDDTQYEYGFLLHDLGKLSVPDAVLNKAGPLDTDEWALVKAHPELGASLLAGVDFLEGAREIVLCHHERWDGHGYPRGLRGLEIPLGARLFPLCDAFDAMTSSRAYRAGMSIKEAKAELRRASGSQFWPAAVEAFFDIPEEALYAVGQEAAAPSGVAKRVLTSE